MKRSFRTDDFRPDPARDFQEEARFHIDMIARDLMDQGMSQEEAEVEARRRFGDLTRIEREAVREEAERQRGIRVWDRIRAVGHSVATGLRTLYRSPGFSAIVTLTLALGIGANTVVFSIVDGTVLNPFPYPDPQTLVGVGPAFPKLNQELGYFEVFSPAEYQDIAEQSRTLDHIVAWDMGNRQLSTPDGSTNVFTSFWWGDAFRTLGMAPAAGRGFLPEETDRGDPVAIISHRLWESLFGSDPEAIGSAMQVNGEPYTLVGVMPPKTLIYGSDLWIPMTIGPDAYARNRRQFQILARIRDGSSIEEVNTELEGIARRVEAAYGGEFEEYEGWQLVASTWNRINSQFFRVAAYVLMGAVGFVLLLVCANLANLMLARATGRSRDFALRSALGAGRKRIASELLVESLILAALGGLLGAGLSVYGINGFARLIEVLSVPFFGELSLNSRVFIFTAGVSMLAGIFFGMLPAIYASRTDLQDLLQSEGRGSAGSRGKHRLQRVFVGVETAVALALLVGSGLLVNSFIRLQRVDPGFDTDNALTMRLTLPWQEYDTESIMLFFRELREEVEGLPGVQAAAVTNQYPPSVFSNGQFSVEGETYAGGGTLPTAYLTLVSPGFFQSMDIPVLAGRTLDERDGFGAPDVALINETAARRYFGDEDPIGRRFKLGGPESSLGGPESSGEWIEVVGVVGDTKNRGLDVRTQPEIFGSTDQVPGGNQFFLIVRTHNDPRSVLPAIRQTVAAMDPDQPIYSIRTIDEAYAASMAQKRIATMALLSLAAFALLLASVGIYSVVAFGVAERTREIGVRIALGAEAAQVRRLVVRQALIPVGIGAFFGLGMAFALHGFLQSLLFEVSGTDPMTFGLVTVLLLGVAAVASYLPARRASRLNPVEALRQE